MMKKSRLFFVFCLLLFSKFLFADYSANKTITLGQPKLYPLTLDIAQNGNIYVGGGNEIKVYNKNGQVINKWSFSTARPVRVAPNGDIWIGRTWEPNTQLRVYTPSGKLIKDGFGMNKWLHGDAVGFDVPFDFLFDPNGNIWSTNTHNVNETESRTHLGIPNGVWGGIRTDPNGGRLMFFNLKTDPDGRNPKYFGTFSNIPPWKGGPADALHLPTRLTFDPVHKKIFVMDAWGITRWDWPSGKFDGRIIRKNVYHGSGLIAATPDGNLYIAWGSRGNRGQLEEYTWNGKKISNPALARIDTNDATDLRVTPNGDIYLCYPDRGISFKKYSPTGKLLLCKGLNVIKMELSLPSNIVKSGTPIPITAIVKNREKLYGMKLPYIKELGTSLWLQPYKIGSKWKKLKIQNKNGTEYITIPKNIIGPAYLRLSDSSVSPELFDSLGGYVQIPIAVLSSKNVNGTISIYPDRNQSQFVNGEWVRINIIGKSVKPVNEQVILQLINSNGNILFQKKSLWNIGANSTKVLSFDFRFPENLPAGKYTLKAISKHLGISNFPIKLSKPVENASFKIFTAVGLGYRFKRNTVPDYLKIIKKDGISNDVSGYIRAPWQFGGIQNDLGRNNQLSSILNSNIQLPAGEIADIPSRMRIALYGLQADGIKFWPEVMGWETDTVNRTQQQKSQDKINLTHWTLWGIKSPSPDGYLWNETNWWCLRMKPLELLWSIINKTNTKRIDEISNHGWWNDLGPEPDIKGKTLKDALSFQKFLAKRAYPDNYRRLKNYAETIRKNITGIGVPAFYWFNWPLWSGKGLDAIMSFHQVEQLDEPWMQLVDCAFMEHRNKPFYAGIEVYPESGTGQFIEREFFPALLYGVQGFWFNDMGGYRHYLGIENNTNIRASYRHQVLANIGKVLQPIGTILRKTTYNPSIGIYFPREEWVAGGNSAFAGAQYVKRVQATLIASFYAHLPAKVIFSGQLRKDISNNTLNGLKVLILPNITRQLTRKNLNSLYQFKSQGGVIIVGDKSSSEYKTLGPVVNIHFNIFENYNYGAWFLGEGARIEKMQQVIHLAKEIKQAVSKWISPPVKINDPYIFYTLRQGRDNQGRRITYLVAINQGYPDNLKPYQLWDMTTSFHSILPTKKTAVLPSRFNYCYDLLRGKGYPIKDHKLLLNFSLFGADVYALSSHKISASDINQMPQYERNKKEVNKFNSSLPYENGFSLAPDVTVFFPQKVSNALQTSSIWIVAQLNKKDIEYIKQKLSQNGIFAKVSQNPYGEAVTKEQGIHIIFSHHGDPWWDYVDGNDIFPLMLTNNIPSDGQAIISWMPAILPSATWPGGAAPPKKVINAIMVVYKNRTGLDKAIKKLDQLKRASFMHQETRLIAPEMQEKKPASLTQNTIKKYWGAILTNIKAGGNTVAVGAAEWGNNFFVLDNNTGKLRFAKKAGRWYVDHVYVSKNGKYIGALTVYPTQVNTYLQLYTSTGKKIARYASYAEGETDNYGAWHGFDSYAFGNNVFSFALSPNGKVVYSSGNMGISAYNLDGKILWRHNYLKLDKGFSALRHKWAGIITLTPDGKYLANGLTHEQSDQFNPGYGVVRIYRGISKVQKINALTGKIEWQVYLPVTTNSEIYRIAISPDGKEIACIYNNGYLYIMKNGEIISNIKGIFKRIVWSNNSKILYTIVGYPGGEGQTGEWVNGILAFNKNGIPVYQYTQYIPITAIVPYGKQGLVFTNSIGNIILLNNKGKIVWNRPLGITGNITDNNKNIYFCDTRGNVYRIDGENGNVIWKTNLTPEIWISNIKQVLTKPYKGKTIGLVKRLPEEKPLEGNNITGYAAGIDGGANRGWFMSGNIQMNLQNLMNDKINYLKKPWLDLNEQSKSTEIFVHMWWPKPIVLQGISIHEDKNHPEAWPYDVCLQAWENNQWKTVAQSTRTPGPWHNLVLTKPVKTIQIRYLVISDLLNNLWTDQIRVIGKYNK